MKGFLKEEDLEPEIDPFFFYFDAFRELSSCRVNGMVMGPIPFTAIVEYSRIYEIEDLEDFLYVIRRMDDAFLALEAKKPTKETKPNANSNSNARNKNQR